RRQARLASPARLHLRALARRRGRLVAVPVSPGGGRDGGGSPPRTAADRERAARRRALLRCDPRTALGFVHVYPMRYSFVADHFQYLASLPLIALAAAGATRLPRPQVIGAGVLLALGTLAWRQALVYRDAETIWRDTLAKDPDSSMAHINLGMLLSDGGRVPEAMVHFREALRIDPEDGEARNDLGNALASEGKLDDAIAEYGAAL